MKIDKFNLLSSLVLLILIFFLIKDKKDNSENFFIDYNSAVKESAKKEKPLFICFNSSLSNQKVSDFKQIKKDYIVCILDLEKDKEIFTKYNIKEIPSYVIVDNKNKSICIEEGYKEKHKLFEWLRQLREN